MENCPNEVAIYAERLTQKEHDYNELQSNFTKYKLKQKVKYDKLRDEVVNFLQGTGVDYNENEIAPLLLIRLNETDSRLEDAERKADSLDRELQRRQTQINDQIIVIRNLEEQLRIQNPLNEIETSERKKMNGMFDLDGIHAQMTYKDERIVELNNVILDRERQILDLQEMCREQGEVASSKKQAMKLVQKKFEELESITRRSIGTETDSSLFTSPSLASSLFRGRDQRTDAIGVSLGRMIGRSASPGRAVKGISSCSSPPPLDPSEEQDDDDSFGTSSFKNRRNLDEEKRKKKRVTFDLPPSGSVESVLGQESEALDASVSESTVVLAEPTQQLNQAQDDKIVASIEYLTLENEQLRRNLEQTSLALAELQGSSAQSVREGKSAALKARVAAQARIKDLEDKMGQLNKNYAAQVDRLQTEVETLRSTREWEIEENARLREQFTAVKEKNYKLSLEVESAVHTNREMEERMLQEHEILQRMMEDIENAEGIVVYQEEQKQMILDDVEKLKDAILAQEQFIEVLEADIVIYEQHIGILRESLGASKIDHRDLIRSKAFELKLKALEEEKQEIDKTRNDERLRTKALNAKVRILETENEKLMARICEMEMKGDDEVEVRDEQLDTLRLELEEAHNLLSSVREEYESQLNDTREDAKKSHHQSQLLRDQVGLLQNDLDTAQARSTQSCSEENTVLEQLETETIVNLRTQLYELQSQLETVEVVKDDLNEHVTRMGAENFELTQRLEQVQNANNDLLNLRAMVNNYEEMLNSEKEKYERNLTEVRDTYQNQIVQLNSELDDLKLCINEKDKLLRRSDEERERLRLQIDGSSVWIAKENAEQAEPSVMLVENTSLGRSTYDDPFTSLARLESENSNLRSELDHARLSLAETREVQREVEWLKGELDEERRQGEAKWAEVCEKLVKAETTDNGDSPGRSISRKASIEEMHCYLDAYAEKCRRLESELMNAHARLQFQNLQDVSAASFENTSINQSLSEQKDKVQELERELKQRRDESDKSTEKMRQLENELQKCKERIDSDKQEKRKLKQAVKQLRNMAQKTEANDVVEEIANNIEIAPIPAPNMEFEELESKLQSAVMEARISSELNVEMSRAMEELEEKIIQIKNERDKEKKNFESLLVQFNQTTAEFSEQSGDVEHLNSKVAALLADLEHMKHQLDKQTEAAQKRENEIQRLKEAEIRREKEHREIQSDHDDEVRALSIANEDLRRILSDMEVKMELKEQHLNELSQRLSSIQSYAENLSLQVPKTEHTVVVEQSQQHESMRHSSVNSTQAVTILQTEVKFQDDQQNYREYSQHAHNSYDTHVLHSNSRKDASETHNDSQLLPCSLSHDQVSHSEHDSQNPRQTGRSSQVCQNEYIMETPILELSSEDLHNQSDATTSGLQVNDNSMTCGTIIHDHVCLLIDQPLSSVTLAEEVPDLQKQISTSARERIELTHAGNDLFAENQLLRECVNETSRMQDDLGNDVERLMTLKEDLETLVDVLKGEIWALNGQLKASVFDRENLSDRVATLDSQLDAEKRRADQLDQDLSEQVELTEKSQRQAAESENESNRRLAECLEMEQRREELEKAYAQLTDYYSQLQSAYSVLYEKMECERVNSETQTSSDDIHQGQEAMRLQALYCKQLSVARDQVHRLRDQLVHLTKDVLGYELASVEAQLTASLESITEMIGYLDNAELTSVSFEEGLFLNSYLNQILAECAIEIDPSISDLYSKIRYMHEYLLVKREEVECSRTAITEQRRVCSALEKRLREMEDKDNGEAMQTAEKTLAETQTLLENRTHECDQLQLRVEELQSAIAELSTAKDEREAARLATRQADVDALFRANAELAHTNVALQNELDENEDNDNTPSTKDEENKWNEAELARLREVEHLLNAKVSSLSVEVEKAEEQIMELQKKLSTAEQNTLKAATDVDWGWETTRNNEQTVEKEYIEDRVRVLEGEIETLQAQLAEMRKLKEKDHSDQEEIFRLRSVEELLRRTISGFEDKLMEAEVRIGELEDTLYEERQQNDVGEDQKKSASVVLAAVTPLSTVSSTSNDRRQKDESGSMGDTEMQADELSILRSMSASLNDTVSQLQFELEESRARIVTLEGNLQTKDTEAEDDWATWSDKISCTDAHDGKAEELERSRQTETQLREQLKNQLNEMEKLEVAYEEEMDNMKRVETELRKRVKELEQQASEREDRIYKQSASNVADKWGSNWEEKSDTQTNEVEQLSKQLEESKSRVAELVTDLSEIRSIHDRQINDMRREVDELQNRLQVAETKCSEGGRGFQNLQSSTASIIDKKDGWSESWQEDNTQYGEVEEILRERERRMEGDSEKHQLEDVVRQLKFQVSELQEKLTEAGYVEVELKQALEECAVLRVQTEEMRARFDEVETQKEQTVWGWGEENEEKMTEDSEEALSQKEIAALREELEKYRLRMSSAEQRFHDTEELETQMVDIRERLEKTLKQNDLLKESEGKLLESVDEYGEQLELYQKEAVRLQLVVNDLERQLAEMDELREKLMRTEIQRDELQRKQDQKTDVASDQLIQLRIEMDRMKELIQEKENLLEQVLAEKQSLSQRLHSVEKTLQTVEQDRDTVKRALEDLRSKLTTRRRALAVMRENSRPSSVASTVDHDVPEEPRDRVSPQSMHGFEFSMCSTASDQGVATQDAFRRRGTSRKNE